MELDSFKTILLRKADGNKNISQLLNDMEDGVFIDSVVEALEKMAKLNNNTGTNANGPVTGFGANLDKTDIHQMRDALGHHLSHYKAALKAHHAAPEGPEKARMRQVADQHLEHLIPLMHLAGRAASHSKNKLTLDYPPLSPWETNYTTLDKNAKGGPRRDPKLLRVRNKNSGSISKTVPDFHYLEMPPHPGHKDLHKMPHRGGYPWEEIQLGDPKDVDAKKAYLHIEDIPDKKEFTPHEFDQHPIRGVQDIQADHMTPEAMQEFANAHGGWRSSEHHKKWMEAQKAKYTADKEGYMKRGQTKGPHFYEGIPLKEQPGHVHTVPRNEKAFAPAATPPAATAPQSAPTAQPSAPRGVPPTVRPAAPKPSAPAQAPSKASKPHPLEAAYKAWSSLPKEHQDNIIDAIPGLREYVITKGGK